MFVLIEEENKELDWTYVYWMVGNEREGKWKRSKELLEG